MKELIEAVQFHFSSSLPLATEVPDGLSIAIAPDAEKSPVVVVDYKEGTNDYTTCPAKHLEYCPVMFRVYVRDDFPLCLQIAEDIATQFDNELIAMPNNKVVRVIRTGPIIPEAEDEHWWLCRLKYNYLIQVG